MSKMRRHRHREPSPSVAEPRRPLLLGAYSFVRAARLCPGVLRIALFGLPGNRYGNAEGHRFSRDS